MANETQVSWQRTCVTKWNTLILWLIVIVALHHLFIVGGGVSTVEGGTLRYHVWANIWCAAIPFIILGTVLLGNYRSKILPWRVFCFSYALLMGLDVYLEHAINPWTIWAYNAHWIGASASLLLAFLARLLMGPRPKWLRPMFHRDGSCTKCGYNLTGNVSGICPECGTEIAKRAKQVSNS